MIKITERTLYEHITNFLREKLNAKTVQEVKVGDGFADILFQLDTASFIVEVKIGGERELAKAIAQVYEYAMNYGTKNVVVLVYPKRWKGLTILDDNIGKVAQIILSERVIGRVYTDYWTQWITETPVEVSKIFEELGRRFIEKDRRIDFNSVVSAIRENVADLYSVIRQAKTKEVFEEVAEKLELFVGLGEIKDRKKAETQVSMLASYLLFNQMFFYHVYKSKTNDENLPELKPIKSLRELENYFNKITNIDYKPIYDIKLIDKIPEKGEVIEIINNTIKNLVLLRAEHVTQDLAGRFFHALLPYEVAKVWAAFYTNPIAAEILAQLAVERWDETVLDPACGSGTLLCAAYRRKLELYEKQSGIKLDEETMKELHKKFLEEDITGIDIMPFAAHLTSINLALQKIEQPTNAVRVVRMDSLELASSIKTPEFKEKGTLLRPFTETILKTLYGERKVLEGKGVVSPAGRGSEFYLKPVDVVIMNPPFSDREKLPSDYRKKLNELKELGKICGHQINLWGYFLALSDLMLKPNGKVALVVPINIARGKSTEKIRNHLLENYHIKYIIKSTKDLAFSESAAFRDILLIAEKRRPNKNDLTTIVFLKESIREIDLNVAKKIVEKIREFTNSHIEDEELEVFSVPQCLLKENFMRYISTSSVSINLILNNFYNKLSQSKKLRKLNYEEIREGFGFRPQGLSKVIVVARPISEDRLKHSELILERETENSLIVTSKSLGKNIKINKSGVIAGLRSLTGIKNIDITHQLDFIVTSKYNGSDKLAKFFIRKINWSKIRLYADRLGVCNIVLPDKLNLSSPNTFLLSVHSEQPFLPSNMFYLFYTKNEEEAKIYSLFFNSTVCLAQVILNKPETLGTYFRMRIEDWKQIYILDFKNMEEAEKQTLLRLFESISQVEFPCIIEQLEKRFWARLELDKAILEILGFSKEEIDELLPKVYDAILSELKITKEM